MTDDIEPPSTTNSNQSGGTDLNAGRDITVGGDVVGRDKIESHTTTNNTATVTGSGTVVQGDNAVAAGAGGVAVGGDVHGDVNVTNIPGDQQYDVHGLANPYLGLQSFTYADCAKYAGREKLITETVARLTAPDDPLALLFITGASGSGKSSFVQAGVLPTLEKHYAALSVKWAVFRPSHDPLATLADALWRQLGLPQFDVHTASPVNFADFLQAHTPQQQVNVIVIDQFEELFTQSNAQPRDAFFALLTQLPPFRSTRTHIIATVRADYLPELFALPTLYDTAKRGIDLRAMSMDELREAIQQPLRAAYPDKDKRFQPELVERLARDAAEDAAYLPLLQVTLEEIWRKGTLTLGAYTNLADAIKQRADKVLEYQDYDAAQPSKPRPPEEQAAILNLCLDLVDVSLDDEVRRDVRRRRSKDELISGAPERSRLIDTLAQARLLSVSTDSGESTRVEVDLIHETLLSNWDRLRQAIAERRHELHQRVRFEQQLKEWIGQNRADDYLLSGVRLAEAHELERRNDIALHSADAKDFIRRSVEREEAHRQKELDDARRTTASQRRAAMLLKWVVIVLVLGIIGSLVGGAIAIQQGNEARIQRDEAQYQSQLSRSRELAAVANNQLDVDPERSILIALEANNGIHTLEAEDALRRAMLAPQTVATLRGHEGRVTDAQFSPDGKWVVTASSDGTAQVWEAATGKELAILRGHEGIVNSAQFSPDGKWVVTASSDDHTARVWEAATGEELAILRGHEGVVNSAEFSPDGQWIVTGSGDGTARVWEALIGKEITTLRGEEYVHSAHFSPDGKWIVVASSSDVTARVWEIATGKEITTLRGPGSSDAQFSPDGQWIATDGCEDSSCNTSIAQVWEVATGKEIVRLRGHKGSIWSLQFSPDGKLLVTGGEDDTARVWEVATGKEVVILRGHENWVNSAQFSPDGRWIVTASSDGTARVWEVATGKEVATLRGHNGMVESARFSPDGQWIVTASSDGKARVWEAAGYEFTMLREHQNAIAIARFSPNGKWIVTASWDHTTRVWNAATGKEIAVLRVYEGPVTDAQFSPDGKWIVTASWDRTARVLDFATGREVVVLRGHSDHVMKAQFSPDGKLLVTASKDGTARVWEVMTGKEVSILRGQEGWVNSAQFSPDGKWIVTASSNGIVKIWEAATGKEIATPRTHEEVMLGGRTVVYVYDAEFSPNGQWIVTARGDRTARLWDTVTGEEAAVLQGHEDSVTTAQFSPNGKQIVTASEDNTARIWDGMTGKALAVLRGHEGTVISAQFSLDGKYIVTASFDKTARMWEAATGQELVVLRGHEGPVNSAQFSPDGKYVVTASEDGTALVYLVHIEDLIALAKTRVTRELTCEERIKYLREDMVCPTPTPAVTPTP